MSDRQSNRLLGVRKFRFATLPSKDIQEGTRHLVLAVLWACLSGIVFAAWFFAFPWSSILLPFPVVCGYFFGTMACLIILGVVSYIRIGPRPRGGRGRSALIIGGLVLTAIVGSSIALLNPVDAYHLRPGEQWRNLRFEERTEPFGVEFAVVPQKQFLDAVFALSAIAGKDYRDFACLARLL